tara:strand:+ start:556 stop:771 length:216 start_codon:yes stop_codon:yes gene_type:complete
MFTAKRVCGVFPMLELSSVQPAACLPGIPRGAAAQAAAAPRNLRLDGLAKGTSCEFKREWTREISASNQRK